MTQSPLTFFESLQTAQTIIRGASDPSKSVQAIVPFLRDDDVRNRLLKNDFDAEWVQPLQEMSIFDQVPGPETTPDGRLVYRPWPESRYLVRIASQSPEQVKQILSRVETDNPFVVHDLLSAVNAMPPEIAIDLAPKIASLVHRLGLWHLALEVGELAARLASAGKADSALELVTNAFESTAQENTLESGNDYVFVEAIKKSVIPALIPTQPHALVGLMIGWLMQAINAEHHGPDGDDYSTAWRPAIEDHAENYDFDRAARIVTLLRDALEFAIMDEHISLHDAVVTLEQQKFSIFRRLRVHLIAEFGDEDRDRACSTMLDRDLFANYPTRHEYARLMDKRWALLDKNEHVEWLSWISAGPEGFDEDAYEGLESDEDRARRRRFWQFEHLHWIRRHLSGNWKRFYDEMRKEHGEPEFADISVRSRTRSGHESPYTTEQLREMGLDRAIEEVRDWRSSEDSRRFGQASYEGLASSFRVLLAENPREASSKAELFKQLSQSYVRTFLGTMTEAVKKGETIELEPVLELCRWIIDRQVDESNELGPDSGPLVDKDWQYCRDSVAELIEEVCRLEEGKSPPRFGVQYRKALWSLIEPLLGDPAKSYLLTKDPPEDPRTEDWMTLALNSPRARAMRALWTYVDWVIAHSVPDRDKIKKYDAGFRLMPEVKEALEKQLERKDDSFEGRAGFGWRLGLLFWLDSDWLSAIADRIFELRTIESDPTIAYGWAPWTIFLFHSRPHFEFYKLLKDQFGFAVDQARNLPSLENVRWNAFGELAEHLMVLYGRGDFGYTAAESLQHDDAIIARLITQSDLAVRTNAVEFVGRSLERVDYEIEADTRNRFQGLWEYYWGEVGRWDAKENPKSTVFGHWFSCGAFDEDWSLAQLEEFVNLVPRANPDHLIMKKLAQICQRDPARSARITKMLIEGDIEGWRVPSWKQEANTILEVAMGSGEEARNVAEQAIDRLGRRGHLEFGELLQTN